MLSKCLTCAYQWLELPSKLPEIPWPKCPPPQTDYLSPDECEVLVSHAEGIVHEMILMALRTGMRQGELKGLQWSAVDWESRVVVVKNSYCDREKSIGAPKNNRIRSIPLDMDLYELLYRRRRKTGYVFLNARGQPLNHSWLSFRLEKVCKKAGLRTNLVAHSSSHIRFASRDEGRSTQYGASSPRTFDDHYDYEVRTCRTVNHARSHRTAKPKAPHRREIRATHGQPMGRRATAI